MVTRDSIHRSKRRQPSRRIDPTSPTSDEDAFALSSTAIRAAQAHDAPLNAHSVIQLQRAIGNRAVSRLVQERSAQRVQRTDIVIEYIDHDPDEGQIDGKIKDGPFFADIQATLSGHKDFTGPYKTQLANAMAIVKETREVKGPDAKIVIDGLEALIIKAYSTRGVTGWSAKLKGTLREIIETTLPNYIVPMHKHTLDKEERPIFNQLVSIIGKQNMSRSKGLPTPIPRAKLPGALGADVDAVRGEIATETNRWTMAALTYEQMGLDNLQTVILPRIKPRYQGNHSNRAGWLVNSPLPANWIDPAKAQIFANASVALRAELAKPDASTHIGSNPALLNEYQGLFAAATAGRNDAALRQMAWLAAGLGLSPYIEFSLPSTGISRLMYNLATGEVFVTAHYKWADAYNPFFRVT